MTTTTTWSKFRAIVLYLGELPYLVSHCSAPSFSDYYYGSGKGEAKGSPKGGSKGMQMQGGKGGSKGGGNGNYYDE